MITHLHNTVASTEADVDNTVMSIVGSLGTNQRDFQHASQMYNSDFFKGESREFQTRLCAALSAHFKGHQNHYWTKNSKG